MQYMVCVNKEVDVIAIYIGWSTVDICVVELSHRFTGLVMMAAASVFGFNLILQVYKLQCRVIVDHLVGILVNKS